MGDSSLEPLVLNKLSALAKLRAKAIFALPLNEVSQPVRTAFGGWVLARVTKIVPGVTRTPWRTKVLLRPLK